MIGIMRASHCLMQQQMTCMRMCRQCTKFNIIVQENIRTILALFTSYWTNESTCIVLNAADLGGATSCQSTVLLRRLTLAGVIVLTLRSGNSAGLACIEGGSCQVLSFYDGIARLSFTKQPSARNCQNLTEIFQQLRSHRGLTWRSSTATLRWVVC